MKYFEIITANIQENHKRLLTSTIKILALAAPVLYAAQKEEHSYVDTTKNLFYAFGGGYLAMSFTKDPLQNLWRSLKPYMPAFLLSGDTYLALYKMEELVSQALASNKYTVSQKERLKELIVEARNCYDSSAGDLNYDYLCGNGIKALDHIFHALENDKLASISHGREEILNKKITVLDNLLSTYDIGLQAQLKAKVLKPFIANSINYNNKMPIAPILLVGPPGVGKTHFVEEIARILDVRIAKPSLASFFKQESASTSIKFTNSTNFTPESSSKYMTLQVENHKKNKSNVNIVFIDEIDKSIDISKKNDSINPYNQHGAGMRLIAPLLKTFNVELRYIHDDYFDIDIPAANTLFIFAANRSFTEIDAKLEPLQSRVIQLDFPALSKDLQMQIAELHSKKVFGDAGLSLNENQSNQIKKMAKSNKKPGVRELLIEVNSFIAKEAHHNVFINTLWDKTREKNALIDHINNAPAIRTGNRSRAASDPTGQKSQYKLTL